MAVPSTLTSADKPSNPSTIVDTTQRSAYNLISTSRHYIDRFFPPERREAWKERVINFANERPRLAAFLLSQLVLSGPPLALFAMTVLTVIISSFVTCILVGLIAALLFIITTVGVALIFLLPALFFTTTAGVFFFLVGLGGYYIFRWIDRKQTSSETTIVEVQIARQNRSNGSNGLNNTSALDKTVATGAAEAKTKKVVEQEKEKDGAVGRSTGAQPPPQYHAEG